MTSDADRTKPGHHTTGHQTAPTRKPNVCAPRGVYTPVAPVAYQAILEPGIGQLREFESPPSAYSHKLVGNFSCAQIDLRKARDRELATLDERPTSSGITEPYARKKK